MGATIELMTGAEPIHDVACPSRFRMGEPASIAPAASTAQPDGTVVFLTPGPPIIQSFTNGTLAISAAR